MQQRPLSEELPAASPTPPGRGWWSWQRAAQGAWIVLALVLLVTFVANIPAFYQSSRTFCTLPHPSDCATGLLTRGNVQALGQLHLSVAAVASFVATLTLAVSVLYWAVGLLIFWRKSQEWMGLFASLLLVMFGAIGIFGFPAALAPPLVQLLTNVINAVVGPALVAFFIIFPTGRFTPRWTWGAFVLGVLSTLPFVPSVVSLLTIPLMVGVQVYRYMRVYDAVQRQQTKWFVFGFGVGFSFLAIYQVLGAVVPGLSAPDSLYQLLNALTWLLVWTLLLLSVSVAILRYRLWDIDVIINRTLVYGSLTVLLVALYVGLILALQALVRVITGSMSQQPLVIVGSTLVIAALFQPLHRRIQNLIDRRFYRRKYDAARVVAAFSSTLRSEVDLDQLREQLIAVVQETMQPAHVSLLVRQPGRTETPTLQTGKSPPEATDSTG
ncbi:MAG: hypothetical protein NVSMB27_07440 [Ktedonobacteraceae bacterium]